MRNAFFWDITQCTVVTVGYYTVYSGNSLLTFWDNLLVPLIFDL